MSDFQITKKQHFVNQAYLRRFTDNGRLYCRNKRTHTCEHDCRKSCPFARPEDVAYINFFYESYDEEINKLEKCLSNLEYRLESEMNSFLNGKELSDEHKFLMQYASLMRFRSLSLRQDGQLYYQDVKGLPEMEANNEYRKFLERALYIPFCLFAGQ